MKKKATLILCAAFALNCVFCAQPKKIDASSNEKLQETFFDAMVAMEDDNKQQQFASSMATIGVVLSQKYSEDAAHKKYVELVNGKTPDEIIALAKSMTPQLRGIATKVNGKTLGDFNKSIGQMLIGMSVNKQRVFSSALAKIMYDAEQKKTSETEVAKMLDGKTADEVIAFARPIKAPFPSNESEEFYITPMTKEELKARNIPLANPDGEENMTRPQQSLSKSLVPRGN